MLSNGCGIYILHNGLDNSIFVIERFIEIEMFTIFLLYFDRLISG